MPKAKKHSIVVRPWPSPKPSKFYKGQIKEATIDKKAKTLKATIMNLDPTMLERLHLVEITLPPRPGNRASRFLSACGQPGDEVGKEIEIDSLIGVIVAMRFTPIGDGYEIEFEKVKNSDRAGRGRDNPSEQREETTASGTGHSR